MPRPCDVTGHGGEVTRDRGVLENRFICIYINWLFRSVHRVRYVYIVRERVRISVNIDASSFFLSEPSYTHLGVSLVQLLHLLQFDAVVFENGIELIVQVAF